MFPVLQSLRRAALVASKSWKPVNVHSTLVACRKVRPGAPISKGLNAFSGVFNFSWLVQGFVDDLKFETLNFTAVRSKLTECVPVWSGKDWLLCKPSSGNAAAATSWGSHTSAWQGAPTSVCQALIHCLGAGQPVFWTVHSHCVFFSWSYAKAGRFSHTSELEHFLGWERRNIARLIWGVLLC